jgi:hypothetical protein
MMFSLKPFLKRLAKIVAPVYHAATKVFAQAFFEKACGQAVF